MEVNSFWSSVEAARSITLNEVNHREQTDFIWKGDIIFNIDKKILYFPTCATILIGERLRHDSPFIMVEDYVNDAFIEGHFNNNSNIDKLTLLKFEVQADLHTINEIFLKNNNDDRLYGRVQPLYDVNGEMYIFFVNPSENNIPVLLRMLNLTLSSGFSNLGIYGIKIN